MKGCGGPDKKISLKSPGSDCSIQSSYSYTTFEDRKKGEINSNRFTVSLLVKSVSNFKLFTMVTKILANYTTVLSVKTYLFQVRNHEMFLPLLYCIGFGYEKPCFRKPTIQRSFL